WLKHDGDWVEEGDPLFELDTAKATLEVNAFASGYLHDLRAEPGDFVEPLQVVALLSPDRPATRGAGEPPTAEDPPTAEKEIPAAEVPAERQPGASPAARALASEHGVGLAGVTGTG